MVAIIVKNVFPVGECTLNTNKDLLNDWQYIEIFNKTFLYNFSILILNPSIACNLVPHFECPLNHLSSRA